MSPSVSSPTPKGIWSVWPSPDNRAAAGFLQGPCSRNKLGDVASLACHRCEALPLARQTPSCRDLSPLARRSSELGRLQQCEGRCLICFLVLFPMLPDMTKPALLTNPIHSACFANNSCTPIQNSFTSTGTLWAGCRRLRIGTIEDVTRNQWADRLIRSWNEGWWEMQLRLGDLLAPLVGAAPGEVIMSDSTTVNLYKLALATLNSTPERSKIVTDDMNFPTDVYVLDGIAETTGNALEIVRSDGVYGPLDALESAIDENTALVSLSHTAFESGYTYDIAAVTEICHCVDALVLWDTSHSVGVVPIDLGAADVDLAIGCTYKYLNGGPGSPAFLYVRTDLQDKLSNPIAGWWGACRSFWIRSRVSTRLRDPTFPLGDYADRFTCGNRSGNQPNPGGWHRADQDQVNRTLGVSYRTD